MICNSCKIQKEDDEFSWADKKSGIRNKRCKSCQKKLSAEHYLKKRDKYLLSQVNIRTRNKQFIYDYLRDKSCVDCGESDSVVLEFDHIDPTQKVIGIANTVRDKWSIEKITSEMGKCEIRCANCHRRKTAKQLKYYDNIE